MMKAKTKCNNERKDRSEDTPKGYANDWCSQPSQTHEDATTGTEKNATNDSSIHVIVPSGLYWRIAESLKSMVWTMSRGKKARASNQAKPVSCVLSQAACSDRCHARQARQTDR